MKTTGRLQKRQPTAEEEEKTTQKRGKVAKPRSRGTQVLPPHQPTGRRKKKGVVRE